MILQVLHVISDLHMGGAGRYLLNILPGLKQLGFEVAVACPGGGELEKELRRQGFPVHPLSDRDSSFSCRGVAEIYRLLDLYNFGIIHTHASLSGRVAARLKGRGKIVLTRHSLAKAVTISTWRRLANKVLCTVLTDKIIAVSGAVAKNLEGEGTPSSMIRIINNGIFTEQFEGIDGAYVREELGSANCPLVGMVARLVPEKAPQVFVRAAAIIHDKRPDVRFLLAGAGPLEIQLRKLIPELGLQGSFYLLGFMRDISQIQAALDIAVLTSEQEAQGLVLLEAMAAGKPVIATDVGGIPEVVQAGRTGLLVPAQNPQAVAKAVLSMLDDGKKAQMMGEQGRKVVRERFSQKSMVEQTAALYWQLLGS